MTPTYNVRFWGIQVKPNRRRKYGVRWIAAGREHSEWFELKAQADGRRSELMAAARAGHPFDVASGLPVPERRRRDSVSLLTFSMAYVDVKWPDAAAKSRVSMVEALADAIAVFVRDRPSRPAAGDLRRVLFRSLLPPSARERPAPAADARTVEWIRRNSRPLVELGEPAESRAFLDALSRRADGTTGAATVYRRKRAVLFNLLGHAVECGVFDANPLAGVQHRIRKVMGEVDPRVVANPAQVRELLTAVTYVGRRRPDRGANLAAFFATSYYAAARPAEGLALPASDCILPASGWGELALGESRPSAGRRWTDSGEVHDRRGLKHRAAREVRLVPIPPVLVWALTEHIDRYGIGRDGRLFRSERGGVVSATTYSRVWAEARRYALSERQVASPLAARPYDLRHAAVPLWLNRGVPATEVAAWAGHSVDVLLKVYAKCIEGDRALVNSHIERAFDE